MAFICGKGVVVGQSVRTYSGWKVVTEVREDGIVLSDGTFVKYGDTIGGWKAAPKRKRKENMRTAFVLQDTEGAFLASWARNTEFPAARTVSIRQAHLMRTRDDAAAWARLCARYDSVGFNVVEVSVTIGIVIEPRAWEFARELDAEDVRK